MRPSTLMNAVPTLVLRTPLLHQMMSGRYLLLTFTGRSTGRRYRTPVAYRRTPGGIVFSTDSPWWRNLATQPGVALLLQGRLRQGIAHRIDAAGDAATQLGRLVAEVPGYRRAAGLRTQPDGTVATTELTRAVVEDRHVFTVEVLAADPVPAHPSREYWRQSTAEVMDRVITEAKALAPAPVRLTPGHGPPAGARPAPTAPPPRPGRYR